MSDYTKDNNYIIAESQEIEGERELIAIWRAVILQAFVDANSNSRRTENKVSKMKARQWLFSGNKDFKTVCDSARYRACDVKAMARAYLKEEEEKHKGQELSEAELLKRALYFCEM